MKKILFAITKSNWGGAQRYVFDLATSLPKDRYEAVAALGGPPVGETGNGPLAQKLEEAGIRVISLPSLQENTGIFHVLFSKNTFTILPELVKLYRTEKPDIVHLNSSKISGLGALAAQLYKLSTKNYKLRTIFTAHGWAFNEDRNFAARWLIYFLQWLTSFLCDHTVILSNHDYRQAINMPFSPKSKFVLIPLGLPEGSVKFFPKVEARKKLSELLHASFLNDGGKPLPTIAVIGELNKNKGLNYLIDAVNRAKFKILNSKGTARQRVDNFKCLIMGDGEDREKLEKQIAKKFLGDSVHILGFVPEAAKYLRAADVFVLSSLKEGLPYTVLEAMHAGTPIIATPAGGLRDLIAHGENGHIVPFKDVEKLGEAICETLENEELRKKFAKESQKRVKEKFSFDAMLKRTIALYES